MLPEQLGSVKKLMGESLSEMYSNFNYFYKVTGSMHNHKNFNEQT